MKIFHDRDEAIEELQRLFTLARKGRLLDEDEEPSPWRLESSALRRALDTASAAGMNWPHALMFACIKQHRALSELMTKLTEQAAGKAAAMETHFFCGPCDHEKLLRKYIQWVKDQEGTDFIMGSYEEYRSDVEFTDQEWQELNRLTQAKKEEDHG